MKRLARSTHGDDHPTPGTNLFSSASAHCTNPAPPCPSDERCSIFRHINSDRTGGAGAESEWLVSDLHLVAVADLSFLRCRDRWKIAICQVSHFGDTPLVIKWQQTRPKARIPWLSIK
ncbi:hypothetical protein chiPu_0000035 [Chiloscyllium punctatum]|uniref:Uncharacterized protein n=1 Tax=Chiloscyllium punctatum TaxID=137246 RepID=A0A401RN35_CHIPU|nr:hypothetical protein [Chiloscyllium punctatum]